MSRFLSDREVANLSPADEVFHSPVPTHIVSNGEFNPYPQTPQQKKVEARIKELADQNGKRLGMDRRAFLRTASGMATAFVAMNEVFGGGVFKINPAEASEPDAATERAKSMSNQFILDDQNHFVNDDYTPDGLMGLTQYVKEHWNLPVEKMGPMSLDRFKFDNFMKEVYLDSDTTVAFLSGAPFDDPAKWFLHNDHIKWAADTVNSMAGGTRMLFHSIITPGQKGWMEEVDRVLEVVKPTCLKGYTIGDPDSHTSMYPWRLDDEKLMYPVYEKMVKAGVHTLAIHKGLLSADYEKSMPNLWKYATVDDLPKAAKDWPQINFVIYHAAQRMFLEDPKDTLEQVEKTGYLPWVSDLAAIPAKHGVNNIYCDTGSTFAVSAIAAPRLAAALYGILVKGLGHEHVFWGTDSVWYGSPQWQIEAFRRLEIPDDMQQKWGFTPLGPANGPVKNAILGLNAASYYNLPLKGASLEPWHQDGVAKMKQAYLEGGPSPSMHAYGYVAKSFG